MASASGNWSIFSSWSNEAKNSNRWERLNSKEGNQRGCWQGERREGEGRGERGEGKERRKERGEKQRGSEAVSEGYL